MTNLVENVCNGKKNITLIPHDCGPAEVAHLDPCDNFRVGAFIAVLGVCLRIKIREPKLSQ